MTDEVGSKIALGYFIESKRLQGHTKPISEVTKVVQVG